MRLEHNHRGLVVVVLSKRNVLALLHKVDDDESARTITKLEKKNYKLLMGEGQYTEVVVRIEPDEEHYAHEERVVPGLAGRMTPETEEFIDKHVIECKSIDPLGHCVLPFGHPGDCFMDGEINA